MKFELHCHSIHSKGRKITWEGLASPREIVKELKRKGIGGFAITDHDSTKAWNEAKKEAKRQELVFIPASEVTTLSGHLIAFGINEPVKSGMGLRETTELVREQGGITIAPHPFDIRKEGVGNRFVLADAVETFNSLNLTRLENIMAKRKAKKAGMPAVGGSDAHSPEMLGMTVNHIDATDVDGVLREIKRGKVEIASHYIPIPVLVSWIRKRMQLSYEDIIVYIQRNYSKPKALLARFMLNRFVSSDSFAWDTLGYFSISASMIYATLRMLGIALRSDGL